MDDEQGNCLAFYPTWEAARKDFDKVIKPAAKANSSDVHSEAIIALEVTPTRAGILQFLKYQCPGTDNG